MNPAIRTALRRLLPLALILFALLVLYWLGLFDYLSYDHLQSDSDRLEQWVASHPILSPILYMIVYATTVAILLPLSPYFSILGGFLWPQPLCSFYALIATTVGCLATYLVARTAWGDLGGGKRGNMLERMRKGFQTDAVAYMLALRISSILPFWMQNIGPAIFQIRFRTFLWTTIVGLIPSRFVYTQAGRGLEELFETNQPLTLRTILNPQMQIAMIALAIFAMVPILYRHLRKHKNREHPL